MNDNTMPHIEFSKYFTSQKELNHLISIINNTKYYYIEELRNKLILSNNNPYI